MAVIQCTGCGTCIYPTDADDHHTFAASKGWGYTFNPFSEKKDRNEFRCASCAQARIEKMQKDMGFRNLSRPTTAKVDTKPPPPPRGFQTGLNPVDIGKAYWERFGGGPFPRTTDNKK